MCCQEDGWDPHLVFLESFAKRVDQEIAAAKDPGVAAKWGWMKSKVREALEFQQKHRTPRMWHIMKVTGAFEKKPGQAAQGPISVAAI